jgi:hypothetical protein
MLLHANKTKKDWIQFLNKHDISQIKTNTMMDNDLQSTENQLLSRTLNRGRRELGCHGRVNGSFSHH